MTKFSFKNDYGEGCHPKLLDALLKSNNTQEDGYGEDQYSKRAKELIRNKLGAPKAAIHFVSGGTQANLLVVAAMLKSHESIICANTGHINVHEAGAIEAVGNKINSVDTKDGKLKPDDIQNVLDFHHNPPHMVKPKMVYISNTTELGTIYSKNELAELSSICKKNKLILFMDGARIAQALCSTQNDIEFTDLAKYLDVMYLGGTKNGALLGEAIIILKDELKEDFGYHLKQRGALLAKGRIIGVQFEALFTDNLYFDLAKHANKQAEKLKFAFEKHSISFFNNPSTSQLFPILPNDLIDKLMEDFGFYVWGKHSESHSAIRLVTSWATTDEAIDYFISKLESNY